MAEALEEAFSSVFRVLREAATESAIPEIPPLLDFVPPLPEPPDLTWMKTYAEKPEWWDDEDEPRCDECGVHPEDTDRWCGDDGMCAFHCRHVRTDPH
jgi:hypothetical protein